MNAFVTGGTGLLGNNLVRTLLAEGHNVRVMVRSREKAERWLGDTSAELVTGDMESVNELAAALKGCDTLFHTAAYFRETFSPGNHWAKLERINVSAPVELFELAVKAGIGTIVHTSSNATIRKREDGKAGEETDVLLAEEALNDYGKSKIAGDLAIAAFASRQAVPVITMKPSWMIGPWDAAPTSAGKLVLDYVNRRIPGYLADSGIDVVDARDVAWAMVKAAASVNRTDSFIVTAHHVSHQQLMLLLMDVTGIPAPQRRLPNGFMLAAAWAAERYAALTGKTLSLSVNGVRSMTNKKRTSALKAKRVLGVTFRPLEETVRDTVDWYRIHAPVRYGQHL
ncbi:SDR family NAD(P)-dependent oxidoreductase [Paenibacillus thailandensis]|uniref:SDR family NAD(P)-dependent oxidoreductase n=1 Tax=Paenibacillus thailandensis TaxID=393250 RepID=A0ABW5QU40_9BACL